MENSELKQNTVRRSVRVSKQKHFDDEKRTAKPKKDKKNLLPGKKLMERTSVNPRKTIDNCKVKLAVDSCPKTVTEKCVNKKVEKTASVVALEQPKPAKAVPRKNQQLANGEICQKRFLRKKKNRGPARFIIDCTDMKQCIRDISIDAKDLKTFLQKSIKVNGVLNDGKNVIVKHLDSTITIESDILIQRNCFKFILKKYLKSKAIWSWVKIAGNGRGSLKLIYCRAQSDK